MLGFPTSDEIVAPDGAGRYSTFQHGAIYWSPTTGAHSVIGTIYDQWAAAGYERSDLGYPVSDATVAAGSSVEEQEFQNGRLYSSGARLTADLIPAGLSFGLPSLGTLTVEAVTDGVTFHGDGFDVTFLKRSEIYAEIGIDILGAQAPRDFTMLLPVPAGFRLQADGGRVDLLAPDSSVIAAIGLPIATDSAGALVDVRAVTAGSSVTFQFDKTARVPVDSLFEAATSSYDDFMSIGTQQRWVCGTNPNDCRRAFPAQSMAQKISSQEFPGADQGDNRADAARHCLWQAYTTEMANEDFAIQIADAHEQDAPGTPQANAMDAYNNVTGRAVGLRNEGNHAGIEDTSLRYAHEARIVPDPVGLDNEDGNDLIVLKD